MGPPKSTVQQPPCPPLPARHRIAAAFIAMRERGLRRSSERLFSPPSQVVWRRAIGGSRHNRACPNFSTLKYDDCKVWGTIEDSTFWNAWSLILRKFKSYRLVLIRDDGTKIIPRDETLDSVKQRFSDVSRGGPTERAACPLAVGVLKWSFKEGDKEPQLVQCFLARRLESLKHGEWARTLVSLLPEGGSRTYSVETVRPQTTEDEKSSFPSELDR